MNKLPAAPASMKVSAFAGLVHLKLLMPDLRLTRVGCFWSTIDKNTGHPLIPKIKVQTIFSFSRQQISFGRKRAEQWWPRVVAGA
ncbi:hypothetical protein [Mucilaginibacter pineti]|uniref:hypothetical protein n=1 Tax=Mucilaginibacter pineti TaxID=1391627 RepID=UPI00115FFA21|nr:hypothetical protein [Mucilaginibacter pineti]